MWLRADTPALVGAIDGTNATFRLTTPLRDDAVVYINGLARLPGAATENGYRFEGASLLLGEVPVPGDTVAIWQPDGSAGSTTPIGGYPPPAGIVVTQSPTLGAFDLTARGAVWQLPSGSATLT